MPGASAMTDAMTGRTIVAPSVGEVTVRAKLGDGTIGGVYLVDQPATERTLVLKIIHPWLSRESKFAAEFATQVRAAARLKCPHTVAIRGYGRLADGALFFATEHLEGTTLEAVLQSRGTLPPTRAVSITTQVCEALQEAHANHVIHRDLRPSNIMVLSRGDGPSFVKVLDFVSAPGGNASYQAPEQAADGPVDARTDVYALACILYEMLAGRPPFEARNPNALAELHSHQPPPPLSDVAPGVNVPPSLEACLMRGLAKDAYHRPQAADIFADELWSAMMAPVAVTDAHDVSRSRARLRARRSRAALMVGAMALSLCALAAVAWTQWSSEPKETQPKQAAAPPSPPASPTDATVRNALLTRSRGQLEAELQRVAILHGVTPAETSAALTSYETESLVPPPGVEPEQFARGLLADRIVAWRARPRALDGAGWSLDELSALFLRMDSPLPLLERRRMLNGLKPAAPGATGAQTAVKSGLVRWIDTHGRPIKANVSE